MMAHIDLDGFRWIEVGRILSFSGSPSSVTTLECAARIVRNNPEENPEAYGFVLNAALAVENRILRTVNNDNVKLLIDSGVEPKMATALCTVHGVSLYAYVSDNAAVQFELMK